jgi:8-oxo-dGTP pyrophosphatase MutT (NUDIX family)
MVAMTRLPDLERRLRLALAGPLPGAEAQRRMAPTPRPGWLPGRSPAESRDAAALLLLFPAASAVRLLLTVRSSRLPSHAGQVSLPGGAVEAGESVEHAALREAHEETGVDPAGVRVLGRLTPLHIPVSGFVLHPIVGVADARPDFRLSHGEVDQLLEPSLDYLLDPGCVRRFPRMRDGLFQDVPYFALDGLQVWGATAMVLAEFLQLAGPASQAEARTAPREPNQEGAPSADSSDGA